MPPDTSSRPAAPGPITAGIADQARRNPGRAALILDGAAVTYAALDRDARRLAGWLAQAGLAPGGACGLTLRDDRAHLTAALALLRLGCRQVTLASHDPPALRAAIAARTGLAAVLGETAADALPGLPLLRAPDTLPDAPPPAPTRPAEAVFASSGTTGRPKLIPLGEADILAHAGRGLTEGQTAYRSMSCEHNNAKKYALAELGLGGTVLLPAGIPLDALAAACTRHGVDLVTLPPERAAALAGLHAEGRATAPWPARTALRVVGSVVSPALRDRLRAVLTPRLHVSYATTETGPICLARPEHRDGDPTGVGPPLPGVELLIVDEAGAPVPPGQPGRIRIRAPGMARGYLDDAEATARAFRDGWFQPGDYGRIDATGALIFVGRDAEMMILGTINVFPAEIERAAEGFPGLAACAAFALRSATLGDIPALAAVEAAPGALDRAALLAHCRARLGVRAPRRVMLVPALPRNAAGKVLRDRLTEMAEEPPRGG